MQKIITKLEKTKKMNVILFGNTRIKLLFLFLKVISDSL